VSRMICYISYSCKFCLEKYVHLIHVFYFLSEHMQCLANGMKVYLSNPVTAVYVKNAMPYSLVHSHVSEGPVRLHLKDGRLLVFDTR
jgi:hypothetical protein